MQQPNPTLVPPPPPVSVRGRSPSSLVPPSPPAFARPRSPSALGPPPSPSAVTKLTSATEAVSLQQSLQPPSPTTGPPLLVVPPPTFSNSSSKTTFVYIYGKTAFSSKWKQRTLSAAAGVVNLCKDAKVEWTFPISEVDAFCPAVPVVWESGNMSLYTIHVIHPYSDSSVFLGFDNENDRQTWSHMLSKRPEAKYLVSGWIRRRIQLTAKINRSLNWRFAGFSRAFFWYSLPVTRENGQKAVDTKYCIPLSLCNISVQDTNVIVKVPHSDSEFILEMDCDVRAVRWASVAQAEQQKLERRWEWVSPVGFLKGESRPLSLTLASQGSLRVRYCNCDFVISAPAVANACTAIAAEYLPRCTMIVPQCIIDELQTEHLRYTFTYRMGIASLARVVECKDYATVPLMLEYFGKDNVDPQDLQAACLIEPLPQLLSLMTPEAVLALAETLVLRVHLSAIQAMIDVFPYESTPDMYQRMVDIAAAEGHVAVLEVIFAALQKKAGNVQGKRLIYQLTSHVDSKGRTPIFSAVRFGRDDCAIFLMQHTEKSGYLLQGNSILHFALAYSCNKVVEHCVKEKLFIGQKDANNQSTYDVAIMSNNPVGVETLLSYHLSSNGKGHASLQPEDVFVILTALRDNKVFREHLPLLSMMTRLSTVLQMEQVMWTAALATCCVPLLGKLQQEDDRICHDELLAGLKNARALSRGDQFDYFAAVLNAEGVNSADREESLLLLLRRCSSNVWNSDGTTPLHLAVQKSHLGCVSILLSRGASPTRPEKLFGANALHAALLLGAEHVAEMLCRNEQCDVNMKMFAAPVEQHADIEVERCLALGLPLPAGVVLRESQNFPVGSCPKELWYGSQKGKAPLVLAQDSPALVELLLSNGAQPSSQVLMRLVDQNALRSLDAFVRHRVSISRQVLDHAASKWGSDSAVSRLLVNGTMGQDSIVGASSNATHNETIIHVACRLNSPQELSIVIANASPSLLCRRDLCGLAPLHIACYRGEPRIIETLFTCQGVSTSQKTTYTSMSPMHILAHQWNCVPAANKADRAKIRECMELLVRHRARILGSMDMNGRSPIHIAPDVLIDLLPEWECVDNFSFMSTNAWRDFASGFAKPGEHFGMLMAKVRQARLAAPLSPSPSAGNETVMAPSSKATAGLVVPWEEVRIISELGRGSFGLVYRAEWSMTDVAVKVLSIADPAMLGNRPNAMQQAVDSFMAEVQLLSQLRHPNVVLFMAMSRMPNGEVAVLTEFCPLGSLFDLLHNGSASSLAALTMKVRLKMAIDIARGMTYLHSQKPPMIHQDLKSMNVLVCEGYTCKVADFGMSIPKSSHRPVTCTGGTPFYLAPETMAEGKVSEKSDVYAFAVVLFELLVRETPFPQLARATVDIIRAKVLEGVRPCPQTPAGQRDWDLHPSVVEIIQRCWHPQSAMRPSFAEIIPLLQGAAASMR